MKTTGQAAGRLSSSHVTLADGNVFSDLGFSTEEAAALLKDADIRIAKAQRLKGQAALAIAHWIETEMLTQAVASEILAASRPQVSDIVNAKLSQFSLDTLVTMLFRTGKTVDLLVR